MWHFCFRVIGLCLLQNDICPLYLNRHVLKYLLGRKIGWHDLAFFDPVMYEGMRQLVRDAETKDVTSMFTDLELTFAIDLCPEEVGLSVDTCCLSNSLCFMGVAFSKSDSVTSVFSIYP